MAIKWTPLQTFSLPMSEISTPWVVTPPEIPDGTTHLKFVAKGTWKTIAAMDACGPDGMAGREFAAEQLLHADCPVGALIGRFGGSTASLKAPEAEADTEGGATKPFAVGSFAIVKLPKNFVGPVLLGFNLSRRPVNVTSLSVEIFSGV